MQFGSVCSGIEAASVAWHPLGWKAAFFSEIEKFPRRVLAHHYPDVPNLGDMTKFREWSDATIDLLVGGTPCQSFSVAGLRKGLADPRGNLMLTYLAIAERYAPRWLVWENVPGVLSSNDGRDFGTLLGGLAELGYGFAYRVLDAQYIRVESHARAVPQRRRRVFVVGHLGDWRRAAAVLFERESLLGYSPPRRQAGKAVAPTLSARTKGGGGLGTDFDVDGGLVVKALRAPPNASLRDDSDNYVAVAYGGNNTSGAIDVATALNACGSASGRMDFDSETFVAHALRGEGFDASEDGTGRGTPIVPVAFALRGREDGAMPEIHGDGATIGSLRAGSGGSSRDYLAFDTTQITSAKNYSVPRAGDPCHPLTAGAHPPAIAFDCKASGQNGFGIGDVASTLRSMGHAQSHANAGGHQAAMVGSAVRRLTPRECERLQGFPDDYTVTPSAKDGPRYKALGNSMAIPPMRWIGERIAAVDAISNIGVSNG